jgi:hypothetical protein
MIAPSPSEKTSSKKNQSVRVLPKSSRAHHLMSYVWGFLGVFLVWCFISHGFWLGWYYGIHMISPADIVFFPYSENIVLNAFFISLLTVAGAFTFSTVRKSFRDFELITLFREKTQLEEEVEMIKSQLSDRKK